MGNIIITKSNNNNLEFVHIPKTGGTAIEILGLKNGIEWGSKKINKLNVIKNEDNCSLWHNSTQEFIDSDTFVVVRNPYERIVSEYNYRETECKNNDEEHMNNWIQQKIRQSYSDPHLYDNHFLPMSTYVYDKNGNKKIDHVLKYENLNKDIEFLFKTYNIDDFDISKKYNDKKCNGNVSGLSKVSINMINYKYDEDFYNFGYFKN